MTIYIKVQRKGGSTYKYILTKASTKKIEFDAPLEVIGITNQQATDSYNARTKGSLLRFVVEWRITDSDTDLSDGTYTSSIKTVKEQTQYLLDEFMDSKVSTTFWIHLDDLDGPITLAGADASDNVFKGVINSMRIDEREGQLFQMGILTFSVGNIIG